MIGAALAAKNSRMSLSPFRAWFVENQTGLLIGALVAAAIVGGLLLIRWVGRRAAERDPEHHTWRSIIGAALGKTTLAFIIVAAADSFSTYANLPPRLSRVIDIAFIVAFALQGAIWARELILGMIERRVADADGGSALANAIALIRVLVSVTAFAIALILILDNLGVNVTALVAGLGIGGIAIGLAAQGIFADLFAALSILFDRPFKRGDTIRYDNSTGTVERIGLKTTRLRSLTGEQLIMGNTKLLEREIHNLAEAKARRITLYLAVGGESSADAVDSAMEAAAQSVAGCKGCKLVRCVLSGAGAGGLAYDLVYDDSSLDNDRIARNRGAILRALIERLAADKLELVRASDQPPAPLPF
ncbi:MAG TPA: mechanosensitive ion channel domain-containing protein [Sphingomicrobium sp.]